MSEIINISQNLSQILATKRKKPCPILPIPRPKLIF